MHLNLLALAALVGLSATAVSAVPACTTAVGTKYTGNTQAFGFGSNLFGQLSSRTDTVMSKPYPLLVGSETQTIAHVSGGFQHMAVVDSLGKKAWIAGQNTEGQSAGGPTVASAQRVYLPIPFIVDDVEPELFTRDTIHAAAGFEHSCIIAPKKSAPSQNVVFCAGDNRRGQLGLASVEFNVTYLVAAVSTDAAFGTASFSKLAAGSQYTVALSDAGEVWAWGANDNGQLGNGGIEDSRDPAKIAGLTNIEDVKCGNNYCLALDKSGTLHGWGNNDAAQLGRAVTRTAVTAPVQVVADVSQFTAGGSHALAVVGGKLYGWGSGTTGATAHPKNIAAAIQAKWYVVTPAAVPAFTDVVILSIAGGADHSLVLDTCGNVYTFGADHFGQLGKGSLTPRSENFGSLDPIVNANIASRGVTPIAVYAGWFSSVVVCQA